MPKRERLILARKRKVRNFFLLFLVLAGLIASGWLLFFSPYLDIDEVIVTPGSLDYLKEGVDLYFRNKFEHWVPVIKVSNTNYLSSLISSVLSQTNHRRLILFSNSQLKADLLKNYPVIKDISFRVDVKNGVLQIFPISRIAAYLYCEADSWCYLVDQDGVVFKVANNVNEVNQIPSDTFLEKNEPEALEWITPDLEQVVSQAGVVSTTTSFSSNQPTINLETTSDLVPLKKITSNFSNSPQLGQNLIPKNVMAEISMIYDLTSATTSPFQVSEVEIAFPLAAKAGLLNIKTANGFVIKIDSSQNFRDIYEVIRVLKEEKLGEKINNLEYLDCRFLPKLYYRFK